MKRLLLLCAATALLAGCSGAPATTSPSSAPATSRAAGVPPTGVAATTDPAEVAALLARPMRLPSVAPGAQCPRSPTTTHSPAAQPADELGLGKAPLYPIAFYAGSGALKIGDETKGPDGLYEIKVVWASEAGKVSQAVVRAARVDGPGRAAVRLYYAPQNSRGDAVIFNIFDIPNDYPSGTFVSGPGCYVYQIDGADYSETVYFSVGR